MPAPLSERALLYLVAAVQFVNVLDFVMVMPMGPDFARALGIPISELGVIGGSYTAAAAISGAAGAFFLDRFDRRPALLVALTGLVLSTAAGAMASGLGTLVAARIAAGAFGGPATALSQAIIADVVPAPRRGAAMGLVMSAFSVASVVGVPLGLELSQRVSWHAPFLFVAALGVLVIAATAWLLPSMRGHMATDGRKSKLPLHLLVEPLPALTLLATGMMTFGVFMLVPNLSGYLQFNLGYPRDELGRLYMVGGLCGLVVNRLVGRLVDRHGSLAVATFGAAVHVLTLWVGMIQPLAVLPVMLVFVLFMMSGAFRMLPLSTLASRVPPPSERAGFLSLQSVVQHMASASGAVLSSRLLVVSSSGRLERFALVASLSACFASALPLVLWRLERGLRLRDQQEPAPPPPPVPAEV